MSRDTTIDHKLRSALTTSTYVMKVEIVYQNLLYKYEGPHFLKTVPLLKALKSLSVSTVYSMPPEKDVNANQSLLPKLLQCSTKNLQKQDQLINKFLLHLC
ncbi:hypothetical protein CEXT_130411 [Caerostris extrusa]|uniref:Uncharacterized protein n=1 Tax=Caerostris extrusa TaxID=172846 RepID=A0AAV4N2Z5_CAEEX|nr:hypothetical protein CEXT_130411 [Caerostris extrusa]